MRLSWSEIRARAKAFSAEWATASYEKGETHSFYNDFFAIFGVKRRQVASYEQRVRLLKERSGFIDLFWPGVLIVEQKSAGLDLQSAQGQALNYFDALRPDDQPRYILTCDFQRFRLLDLDTGREIRFTLPELYKHIEAFAFVLGRQQTFRTQAAVNIKAAELLGRLHDALEESEYRGHDLERLLVRLLFCLFADDTGIFEPKDIFLSVIEQDSREDGSNVGQVLTELFDVLDTPEPKRQNNLRPELAQFPYVNGGLFDGHVRTPVFDTKMRSMLLDAARFDWGKVSPAIFGSLFQSVMEPRERRAKGAHYTSETNILKVIGPLFLDDLRSEFARLRERRTNRNAVLGEFQKRLSSLRFLDPACGCGNFLVVAYRELRRLELDVLTELYGDQTFDLSVLSIVNVDQFYGIELEEFPARIAEVAMWMTDHIANNELSLAFGQSYARIPLRDSPHIRHADALATDWAELLPADECTFIMGNPPFVGHQWRSADQQRSMNAIWGRTGQFNRLDFCTCWFKKAVDYASANHQIGIGLVATNSICQGEQAGILWPFLFSRGAHITFAHRPFVWTSEARGKAAVHCVILGLSRDEPTEAVLFDYADPRGEPHATVVRRINGYLIDGARIAIPARTAAPEGLPPMFKGSQPTDGARLKGEDGRYVTHSNLVLDHRERALLLEEAPEAAKWLRPFVGGEELISGQWRWCLWLKDADPSELRQCPAVLRRLERVREGRLKSPTESVRISASTPALFTQDRQPDTPYIAVPEVSSENRDYIPMSILDSDVIASNKLQIIPLGDPFHLGVLISRMHMAWVKTVAGRLESRFSYSPTVYNTFPWPDPTEGHRQRVASLAQHILEARDSHTTCSLADLYDPDLMPGDLRKLHTALDREVDRLYRAKPFSSDRERVEHLFARYEAASSPLEKEAARRLRRTTRASKAGAGQVSSTS